MRGIVDRFEGDFAIIEVDGNEMIKAEVHLLPKRIKEGDCVYMHENTWHPDIEATKQRSTRITKLMDDVFE